MFSKIRELTGKATVLIVSHDMNAMTKFCRRVMVMNHGQLVFDGEPQEAVTRYFKIKQGEYKNENTNALPQKVRVWIFQIIKYQIQGSIVVI